MSAKETIEIKEDEEQEKKGHEVMELLVAAGYFRARIKVNIICNLRPAPQGRFLLGTCT